MHAIKRILNRQNNYDMSLIVSAISALSTYWLCMLTLMVFRITHTFKLIEIEKCQSHVKMRNELQNENISDSGIVFHLGEIT